MAATTVNTARIVEVHAGIQWNVIRPGKRIRRTRTAVAALELVKRGSRQHSELTGKTVITTVSWEPTTAVGRAVVQAIVGGAQ